MHALPPELLVDVFVSASRSGPPFTPLTISAVCRLWRAVCLSSPRLWQLIIIDVDRPTSTIAAHADLWIARSAPLSFGVDVELLDFERLLPIMSCFLPHLSRWMDCRISFQGRTMHTRMSDLTLSAQRRVLHHLDIRLKTPFETDADADADSGIFFSNSARHVSMKVAISILPFPDIVNSLQFTSLDITETSLAHTFYAPELLDFLAHCPKLEHLHLHGVLNEDIIPSVSSTIVALPQLHTLLLDLVCIQRSILSQLHLPALRVLHLHRLNSEASLCNYHLQEPGDSDDEAQDFSQSPSSDHHTGMGLRRLLLRSSPPLEILDMDFSDMRTKDFRWVFDRLPHLKHFSITGSDMSDKVVQLFEPIPIESDSETKDGLYCVRLPHLTTLKLFGCQRFSGEALVKALSARVAYTDTATPRIQTLSNVVVSGCLNFTAYHGVQLLWHLRGRLHFS